MTTRPNSARPLIDRVRNRFRRDLVDPLQRNLVMPIRRRRNAGRRYRPVFIAGAMGSGTTLLAYSLGSRFDCAAVIAESALEVAEDSFLRILLPERFESIAAMLASFRPEPSWSVAEGRAALLDLYGSNAAGESEVVIDKGPNTNLVRAPFLLSCFPDARFVVVFRDPVATIEGFRRKWAPFRDDPLEESIRFYADLHQGFLDESAAFADRVTYVSYETLTDEYDASLDAIGSWLELQPARQQRRLATRANVEGKGIRNVRKNRIEVSRDANHKSYGRLAPEEVAQIRETLTPLYDEMVARSIGASRPLQENARATTPD